MAKDFIYLASASPRRRALLSQIGVRFEPRPAAIDETPAAAEAPDIYVSRMAQAKADAVWDSVRRERRPAPVLGADTAVVVGAEIFGKPADEPAALAMLERLSGRTHQVLTAVAIRFEDERAQRLAVSEVRFRATTAAERAAYCRTEEPFDKAGGYGIQGFGAVFIERLVGSYSAVMGLPLAESAELLARFALPAWLHADTAES